MAQKVQILVTDDLDGTEGADTVSYALDGITYEIDLNEKNAAKLRDALAKYIAVSRRTGKVPGAKGPKRVAQDGPAPSEIREWAKTNGMEVPERGRIPAEVRDAYDAVHAA